MKVILGIGLIVFGIVFGLYVGVWVMFIGGIIQVVDAVQIHPVPAMHLGLGILRIVSASFVGIISAFACIIPGVTLLKK